MRIPLPQTHPIPAPVARIVIPAGTVVFDRTGGHLFRIDGETVIEQAYLEVDEYVFRRAERRVHSVPASAVRVLPGAEA